MIGKRDKFVLLSLTCLVYRSNCIVFRA